MSYPLLKPGKGKYEHSFVITHLPCTNSTVPPFYPLLSTLSLLRVLTEQRCAMQTDGVPGCQLRQVPNMFILPLTCAQCCLYSTSRLVCTDPSNLCPYTKDLIIISDVFAPIRRFSVTATQWVTTPTSVQ